MIKLISAKDAAAATSQARAKIARLQHEAVYKRIKDATEKGYNVVVINYTDVQFVFEVLRVELLALGFIVERKQPVSMHNSISLPQEVHISW